MNREILFRGFHPDEEGSEKVFVNGEWVRGYWAEGNLEQCQVSDEEGERTECTISSYFRGIDASAGVNDDVLPETVGQYTGLTDKNGKKIIEGDVLKIEEYKKTWVGNVFFDRGSFWVQSTSSESCPPLDICGYAKSIEVIGKTLDNPELIGGMGE